jgi:hypothetical protein
MIFKYLRIILVFIFASSLLGNGFITRVEEQKVKFADEFSQLQQMIASRKSTESESMTYGGSAGNDLFEFYRDKLIIPALSSYLKTYKKDENDEAAIKNFESLIDGLGNYRQEIAYLTPTINKEKFGQRAAENNYIEDPVNNQSFPAWRNLIENWIRSILNNQIPHQCHDLLKAIEQADTPGYEKTYLEFNNNLFISPVKSRQNTYGTWQLSCSLRKSDSALEDLNISFQHLASGEDSIRNLTPYFLRTLSADNSDPEVLQENLARLLLKMSHQSIFLRGQAAVTEWLLEGIASSHGYKLVFSQEWKSPQFPNPDQHALSYFDEDKFIQKFKDNTLLSRFDL